MSTLRERIEATIERFEKAQSTGLTMDVLKDVVSRLQADLDEEDCDE